MISRDTYLKLRAMTARYEAARKKFDPKRYERGGGYDAKDRTIISAMAGTRDTTNEEKAQIEDFEWRVFPPSRYFGYYDKAMTKITGFMGNLLGRIVYKGPVTRAFSGKRQNVTVRGTNNVMYSGICNLTGGTYCRLKRILGKRFGPGVLANAKKRKRPAAKKRKGPSYQQILDYYASLAPRGRSRRNSEGTTACCLICKKVHRLKDTLLSPPLYVEAPGGKAYPAATCGAHSRAEYQAAFYKAMRWPLPKSSTNRARRNPVKKAKHFIVVTVSKNTNSFGLRGMILMARDGEAWQVGANHLNVKKKGDLVRVPASAGPVREASWVALGYEIPERLRKAPPRVAAEVWG